jgi:predicted ester cyclase
MTHQGEFMGIAPTGKPVTGSGQGFVRVRDGKIVEEHEVFDAFGLMQQLGAVPES